MTSDYEKRWFKLRKEFLKENPANHQGYWTCYLGRQWTNNIEVDHKLSRSGNRDLVFDKSNLAISCVFHNRDKGSMSEGNYKKYLKEHPKKLKCS